MNEIILNIIIVIFPVLIYLVFSCYNSLTNKYLARLVFIMTVCTSLYLSLSFNNYISENSLMLMFCNIPSLICYLKKECKFGLLLSLMVVLVSYYEYDVNIYIVSLKYFCYLLTYVLLVHKKEFNFLFLKIVAIIQGFFMSFEYFYTYNYGIEKVLNLILYAFLIYLITFLSLYLFELADGITSLHIMANKMEKENSLRDSLFKLTHEIKNPIAVCKGYMDMLNLDNREKSEKYVKIIKSEIDRSLNVMNDFMEYSKIKITKEMFDITLLMDEIYNSFKLLVDSKKIKFNYDNNYDDVYIMGDFDRLKQVLVNVIKNSVESIQNNGIINLSIEIKSDFANIIISDNGEGMTKEELSSIKEMFYTTKKCGTGLGVALSNEIILAHNGKLDYNSVKNEGTTCTISLPL